jgi:hypothetical protein
MKFFNKSIVVPLRSTGANMRFHLNMPAILLISFIIRLLAFGASIGDAGVLASLVALYSFYLLQQERKEIPVNKEITDRLEHLENNFKEESERKLLERVIDLETQLASTRDKVNSINLGSQFKR